MKVLACLAASLAITGCASDQPIGSSRQAVRAAQIFMTCTGWSAARSEILAHSIEIDGDHASIDGVAYDVRTDALSYALTRHGSAVEDLIKDPQGQWVINRLTGDYIMSELRADHAAEWPRPGDPGCVNVTPKF